MTIISEDYSEEKIVKLTQPDINKIIDELEGTEHNIFIFLDYQKIIDKLKGIK
jgi:hypothetical protein